MAIKPGILCALSKVEFWAGNKYLQNSWSKGSRGQAGKGEESPWRILEKGLAKILCIFDCKICHHLFLILNCIFLTQDALEHKQKMEAENKALKEKLDREVSAQVK